MANNNPQHVVTGKVRLSYVHLFTPYANPNGGDPKFSTTILLPKSDVATKMRIDSAINAAIQAGVSSRWNGVRPPQVAIPVHDGDGVRPSDGMPFGDECKGHWVFTASSKDAPQIVDASLNPVINQSDIYSGIYARVSIQFFPYANSGKKGIGCGLGNIQKLEDGEPLGSRTNAADDFGGGAGGYIPPAAPNPAYQPGYSQPQPAYQAPMQQPGYPQQPPQGYVAPIQQGYPQPPMQQQGYPQQQPAYPQQTQQPGQQLDPITGLPVVPGGIMGL